MDTSWVFRTSFSIPDSEYCVLRFGSLNYSADVYVNGTCVASADTTLGTFIVREFDVSSLVNRKNTLEVRVHKAPSQALNHGWVDWNKRPEDESMGITGPVELITTPAIQIQDVFVKPIVDPEDLSRARVSIAATLVNRSSSAVEGTLEYLYEDGTVRLSCSRRYLDRQFHQYSSRGKRYCGMHPAGGVEAFLKSLSHGSILVGNSVILRVVHP